MASLRVSFALAPSRPIEAMDVFDFRERGESGLDEELETLAHRVIGAAIEVHRELGAGLPEISYRNALCHELSLRQIPFRQEVHVPIYYKGVLVGEGFVDILVDERLVLELKVVEAGLLTETQHIEGIGSPVCVKF